MGKMTRKIVRIDEDKCNGCGQCVSACAEGAIQIIDGKARLVSESYCDGLGACLGDCPEGAIMIEEREADAFDEQAVERHLAAQRAAPPAPAHVPAPARLHGVSGGGCPGSAMRSFQNGHGRLSPPPAPGAPGAPGASALGQWPVQLMLVPPHAPFLSNADLLICADCVPFAVPDFHRRYLAGRAVLVGCPKLDDLAYYREKLVQVFAQAQPASLTVLRMEVPCCAGIAQAVLDAAGEATPHLPVEVHTIGIQNGIRIDIVPAARQPARP